jgi:hypothetical protein
MAHKWDYEYPCNVWESLPFWVRWPAAVLVILYFLGGLIAGTVGILRLG